MSISSRPRVVRKHNPRKHYTINTYRKAFGKLMDDFEGRCAYSLIHVKMVHEKSMHIDHHNPKLKRKSPYSNLFPAWGPINMSKGDSWPNDALMGKEIRFLNPCKETEYGECIFENPSTNELVGTTAAARYHIHMLDLNNPTLILHRRERSLWKEKISQAVISRARATSDSISEDNLIRQLLEIVSLKIPDVPAPPVADRT